jgi:hypothetical protein
MAGFVSVEKRLRLRDAERSGLVECAVSRVSCLAQPKKDLVLAIKIGGFANARIVQGPHVRLTVARAFDRDRPGQGLARKSDRYRIGKGL